MHDVEYFKAKLTKRLEELKERVVDTERQLDSEHSSDWEESAVEREGDEVLESLGSAGLLEIEQIYAALKRIEADEFGDCLKCGEEISVERLEVVPHATLCRDCAREVEKRQ